MLRMPNALLMPKLDWIEKRRRQLLFKPKTNNLEARPEPRLPLPDMPLAQNLEKQLKLDVLLPERPVVPGDLRPERLLLPFRLPEELLEEKLTPKSRQPRKRLVKHDTRQ